MLNAQKSAPINDCGNFSGPGTKYKDPTTDSSVSRKSLVCTTPYRSPNLGSGFHHQRQVRVPKKQSGDEHPHTHASSEAVYAHMCESDSSESKAPSHGPGAIVNLKSPGFVHKLDLPACPTLRALPSLQHRPFNLAKSVDDLICTRATALSAARALRREQEATFAPPQADLQKRRGAQSYVVPSSSNVFTAFGAHSPPWFQIASASCGTSRPWSTDWLPFTIRLHRFYKIVKSAGHNICPACIHSLQLYSITGIPHPTQATTISGAVSGYDMGLNSCLKHTYSKNVETIGWDTRIAAAKMQKDIDAGFVDVSSTRPRCKDCRLPVSRIQLMLVPKDSRHTEFDISLSKFNRLVWNYSSPVGKCLNEFIRWHKTTGNRRPDYIVYGTDAHAARMIFHAQDRADRTAAATHISPGRPPFQQLLLCVLDQPAAYRQLSTDTTFQNYACALLLTFDDPSKPLTSTMSPRWVQDRRANFGAVLSGFHQYGNSMQIIGATTDIFTRLNLNGDAIVNTDDFLLVATEQHFDEAKSILVKTNAAVGYSLVGKPAPGFPNLGSKGTRTLWCGAVYGSSTESKPAFREIPQEYLAHTIRIIESWKGVTSAGVGPTEQLIGTLLWLCQIAPSLRPICEPVLAIRRALAQLEMATRVSNTRETATAPPRKTQSNGSTGGAKSAPKRRKGQSFNAKVSMVLPPETPAMLQDILSFLTRFIQHPISRLLREEEFDVESMLLIFTDSQPGSTGLVPAAGVFVAGFYATIIFTDEQIERATRHDDLGPENNCLELWVSLIGLILAWKLFPDDFGSIPRLSIVDSSVAAGKMKKNRARHPESNRLLRTTNLVAAISGFQFAITQQPVARVLSADMRYADPLSRFEKIKFHQQIAQQNGEDHIYELNIPPALIDLTNIDHILEANLGLPASVSPQRFQRFWRSKQAFTAAPSYQGK